MFGTGRRVRYGLNIWPGFVDALATLLLVFVFMLSLFMVAQYYLSETLSGRNEAIAQLRREVQQLAETLSLERTEREQLEQRLAAAVDELQASLARREALREELLEARRSVQVGQQMLERRGQELAALEEDVEALRGVREKLDQQVEQLGGELAAEREASAGLEQELRETRTQVAAREEEVQRIRTAAEDEVARLNRQIAALREQLREVATALEAAEQTVSEQRAEIRDLGQRLNVALAQRVQELEKYRSEFFGQLREVLGDHPDIRVVGDRFLFQSELLFESASAQLSEAGHAQLQDVARTLKDIAAQIPEDIPWVLQVEGHTDRRPISTPEFPSNWELSTARANSVVHFLIDHGIPAGRLAAAGFAQYHPVDQEVTEEAFRRNRRIELRLTRR